jgi:hypothetical protein
MSDLMWQKLEEEFAEFPEARAEPVSVEEIRAAERELGMTFSNDYVEFIRQYGGAQVGPQDIFGLRRAELMGTSWPTVTAATNSFKTWPGMENKYVVSMDGAGNPIGIDSLGVVWISDHNAGYKVEQIAESFAGFVIKLLEG